VKRAKNMRERTRTGSVIVAVLAALLLSGCPMPFETSLLRSVQDAVSAAAGVPVAGVTLNKSATVMLVNGSTEQLTATITPANATDQDVTWASNNILTASVGPEGLVTAGAYEGTATITATTSDGGKTATCVVTVTSSAVAVTGIALNKSSTTVGVGGREQLTATITPANATNQNLTWASSNTSAASVGPGGLVTAGASAGTATITVTTVDGGKTATCSVTVSSVPVSVTGVTLSKSSTTISVGSTEQLTATITPVNATNQNLTWASSNTSAASVGAGGLVAAGASPGTATITVTTVDGGKTATCAVTVAAGLPAVTTAAPSSITGTTATGGGTVTSDGGTSVTARGVCWGTSAAPTTANTHTSDGTGTGSFASSLSGLAVGTLYHVRAYATNGTGTAYGDEVDFTTDFSVTFNKNDAEATGTMSPMILAGGSSANLTVNAFNKTGYSFAGWATTSGGSVAYADQALYTMGTANATLYAKWTVNTYTVTYNGNGNTEGTAPGTTSHDYGSTVTVASNSGSLKKINVAGVSYRFSAWNTQADGNGTDYAAGSGTFTMGVGNVVVYAKWVAYVLRDTGPAGGLVFYDKGSYSGTPAWRYLEAAPSDQSTGIGWSPSYGSVSATATAIGTGKANTDSIVGGFGVLTSYAARICKELNLGGYTTGWFLPSKDELNLMYSYLKVEGVGGFSSGMYWSSSEINSTSAWWQQFSDGWQNYNDKVSDSCRVRAVRAF
jgi:uncharacterized repeat protein (TIGR02543 family)